MSLPQRLSMAVLCFAFATGAFAQPSGPLLMMPEPIEGFVTSTTPIGDPQAPQAYLISMQQQGMVNQVQVMVELRDLSEPGPRVASTKAYVNAFVDSLVEAGLEIAESDMPELTPEATSDTFTVDISFTRPDGNTIFTRQLIFFTDRGYCVRVIAGSEESLEILTEWASFIQPITGDE
ncbi:MAG: hypothetical protein AAF823_02130 [Planctomycetota bacterium]